MLGGCIALARSVAGGLARWRGNAVRRHKQTFKRCRQCVNAEGQTVLWRYLRPMVLFRLQPGHMLLNARCNVSVERPSAYVLGPQSWLPQLIHHACIDMRAIRVSASWCAAIVFLFARLVVSITSRGPGTRVYCCSSCVWSPPADADSFR